MMENGPIQIQADGSVALNTFAWSNLVDYIWVDQPVYVLSPFFRPC